MLIAMAGALWVALVASIAALVSAVLAPLTNWLVATAAHRHEREMRIREDKIRAYTNLLRECRRRALVVEQAVNALSGDEVPDEMPEPLAWDLGQWLDESAFTLPFLSDEVSAELSKFENVMKAFAEFDVSEFDDPEARVGLAIAGEGIKLAAQQSYDGLAETIRRELST